MRLCDTEREREYDREREVHAIGSRTIQRS